MKKTVATALVLCMAVGMLPARSIVIATQFMYIRKNWLDALNMAVPPHSDELYASLKAARDAGLGGEKAIAFSSDLYAADPFYGWICQMDAFIDYSQVTEEAWIAYHDFHDLLPGASWRTCSPPWRRAGTWPSPARTAAAPSS